MICKLFKLLYDYLYTLYIMSDLKGVNFINEKNLSLKNKRLIQYIGLIFKPFKIILHPPYNIYCTPTLIKSLHVFD